MLSLLRHHLFKITHAAVWGSITVASCKLPVSFYRFILVFFFLDRQLFSAACLTLEPFNRCPQKCPVIDGRSISQTPPTDVVSIDLKA